MEKPNEEDKVKINLDRWKAFGIRATFFLITVLINPQPNFNRDELNNFFVDGENSREVNSLLVKDFLINYYFASPNYL